MALGCGGGDTHRRRRGNHTPAAGWHVSSVGATGGLGAVELHTAVPAGRALVVIEARWAVAAEAMAAEFLAVEAVEVALLAALPRLEAAFASHPLKFVSDVGGFGRLALRVVTAAVTNFAAAVNFRVLVLFFSLLALSLWKLYN